MKKFVIVLTVVALANPAFAASRYEGKLPKEVTRADVEYELSRNVPLMCKLMKGETNSVQLKLACDSIIAGKTTPSQVNCVVQTINALPEDTFRGRYTVEVVVAAGLMGQTCNPQ